MIVRRRTELGLSQRALGREAGLTSVAVSILEAGQNHAEVTLRAAKRLADALGLPLQSLVVGGDADKSSEPQPDDIIVEAILVSAGQALPSQNVAQILGWDMERVGKAIEGLRERLDGTGVLVHRASSGYMIRPRGDLLSEDELRHLERARLRTRQLREPGMRLLLKVATGGLSRKWKQTVGNADRVSLGMLINSGLAIDTDDGVIASPELIKSLKL